MGSENRTPSNEHQDRFEWAHRFFEAHEDFIRSVIRYAIKDPSERDDFFQEMYLYFCFNPPSEELRNPQAYLYRIVVDRGKDWNRRHYRRRQQHRQYLDQVRPEEPEDQRAEADLCRREDVKELLARIESYLSENEARAIVYRYRHEYTLQETARLMGLKPKTISRYISIGLKKMRELLKDKERAE